MTVFLLSENQSLLSNIEGEFPNWHIILVAELLEFVNESRKFSPDFILLDSDLERRFAGYLFEKRPRKIIFLNFGKYRNCPDFAEKSFSFPDDLDGLVDFLKKSAGQNYIFDSTEKIPPELLLFAGNSSAAKKIRSEILACAKNDDTLLILGPNGSGKSKAAEAVHKLSWRKNKALVQVDGGRLSGDLAESELFGHIKGAFTGADRFRKGKFLLAQDSSLFIDEIGNMTLDVQQKLLSVLSSKKFEAVGSDVELTTNARLIFATNSDLKKKIALGEFREDLFYRIANNLLILPSLKDRKEDIPFLVKNLLEEIAPNVILSDESSLLLKSFDWPGNVRQLENTIKRAVNSLKLSGGNLLTPDLIEIF